MIARLSVFSMLALVVGAAGAHADGAKPLAADDARMKTGAAIYVDTCQACHGAKGAGVDGLIPRLAKSESVQAEPTGLIAMVLQGGKVASTPANPTGPVMPSLGWRLNDTQVADVLTYIRNNWGNGAPPVAAKDVKALRQ